MANLKPDSPLSRRIVLSFLDFLNSVEAASPSDVESLEVAKDCLSEAFKIDSSSASSVPPSDSMVQMFSSRTSLNENHNQNQIHRESRADTSSSNNNADTKTPAPSQSLGDINNPDKRPIGVHELEDELFGKFFGALEKVHYFETSVLDEEQALERATQLFHTALMEMKKAGSEEFDVKNLADTFKLLGNKAVQSKVYYEAIELYTVAIALRDDNAVYYCNRAAAYTQANEHTQAIHDCHKAIAIDPNYSKAYSRLGCAYYAQGNYRDAIDKGFKKALQLDPNNDFVKGNIQAAEQKLREAQQRAERDQNNNSSSTSHSNQDHSRSSHGPIPPPFSSIPFSVNGQPFDMGSMLRNMTQGMPGGSSSSDEPGIRMGVNAGQQMPEEIYGTIRSVMQMFSDGTGTPPHANSQHNNTNNNNNQNSNGN